MKVEKMLKFGKGNLKLKNKEITFSLPAGYSCPCALDCLSKADKKTGKIADGKHTKFRCFAASDESRYKNTRSARWHNFEILKGKNSSEICNLIHLSLPARAKIVRIHVSGDFFNLEYFKGWLAAARLRPDTIFYAYTKSLHFWAQLKEEIPNNLVLTASKGGRLDYLISQYNLRYAEVVFSEAEAEALQLPIDNDDSIAQNPQSGNFALLLHGTQAKDSKSAEALKIIKKSKR